MKNLYNETIFDYDADSSVKKREEYEVNAGKRTLLSYNNYVYQGKKLTKERYGSYTEKDETIANYEYGENGKISKLDLKKGALHKTISYQYDKGLLVKAHIETNTANGLERELATQNWLGYKARPQITLDYEYQYDKEGGLIDVKYNVDGELLGDYENKREYY